MGTPAAIAARRAGFTVIELVVVLILVGILSFVALPRMMDQTMDVLGFRDAARAAIQHARKVAVASRHFVCVDVTTGEQGKVALRMDPRAREAVGAINCSADLRLPAPGSGCSGSNEVCASKGVQFDGASLVFDPLGRVVSAPDVVVAADRTLTVTNMANPGNTLSISIAAETGYVQ